ncbi:MAG: Mrp/NBP35 family ATP-binding protein [Candidatus Nanopelagicales bacterium]
MAEISREAIDKALATVDDPEIHKPITELGMVKSVDIDDAGAVDVGIFLTVSGCPMRAEIVERVTSAVKTVDGVSEVRVELDVMDEEQRKKLREHLQGPTKDNPFNRPGNTTKIIAVASGKGGVGKSSLTANLAVSFAKRGLKVGLVDADIYGHSIPRMLGVIEAPTVVDGMLLPPEYFGVRVISMLPFKPGGITQAVAFRGPMLHRALEQFLTDVYWGDLDILVLDLPPGTGDVAISIGQLLPKAELVVVTTPQGAAAEVSIRAGMLAQQTHQQVAGVIENMSGFPCPHCGEPIDLFGVGGGSLVAETLTSELGSEIPLLARVPFDVRLREGGDAGVPLVESEPDSPAALAIGRIADALAAKPRGLAGMSLGLTPASKM